MEYAAYYQCGYKEGATCRTHQGTMHSSMGVNAETVVQKLREEYSAITTRIKDFPALIKPWIALAYVTVMQPYADMTEGKRFCWNICAFNTIIYGFWKFSRLQPFMMRSFTHNPLSGLTYTMLTSTFRYSFIIPHVLSFLPMTFIAIDHSSTYY